MTTKQVSYSGAGELEDEEGAEEEDRSCSAAVSRLDRFFADDFFNEFLKLNKRYSKVLMPVLYNRYETTTSQLATRGYVNRYETGMKRVQDLQGPSGFRFCVIVLSLFCWEKCRDAIAGPKQFAASK